MWRGKWRGSVWRGTVVDSNKIYLMLVSSQLISARRHEKTNGQRLTKQTRHWDNE